MSATSRHEHEIPTAWSQKKAVKLNGRFLKGPIPLRHISTAAKLRGQALSTFLAIHHQVALTRRDWVTLPKGLLNQLGVSRDAKARALQHLEAAALIQVIRVAGRTARVRLLPDCESSSEISTKLGTIWRNPDWELTAAGLSSRHQQYWITVGQLTETCGMTSNSSDGTLAMWPVHMAQKSWVDIERFIEAYERALIYFKPAGWEMINLHPSFARARVIAARRTSC